MAGLKTYWASLRAQLVKNPPAMQETRFDSWVGNPDLLQKGQATHSSSHGHRGWLHGGSAGKESDCYAGDLGSFPGLGRSPEEGKGYPLQYSHLENSMDCIAHEVARVGHE